jgi:DNA-directed RNA polymerase specialized sigma24 family protein
VSAQAAPIRWDELSRADLDRFVRTRLRLFTIAHRIVGDVHEAEDVVQDVWLRWLRVDRATVIDAWRGVDPLPRPAQAAVVDD